MRERATRRAAASHSIIVDAVDCMRDWRRCRLGLARVQPKMTQGAVPERKLLKTYPAQIR